MFITDYCKENKVAILVQTREQYNALLEVFEIKSTIPPFPEKGAASFTIERRQLPSGVWGTRCFMYTTIPEQWDDFAILTWEEFVELADESKPIITIPQNFNPHDN